MKFSGIFFILVLFTFCIGYVIAVEPPNSTFETQGIQASETISVLQGSVLSSESMTMTVADNPMGINAPPLEFIFFIAPGSALVSSQTQATNVYTEMTDAKNGQNIEYSKTTAADTANKVLGTWNTQTHRSIQYETNPNKDGRMTSNEQIIMDVEGNAGFANLPAGNWLRPTPGDFLCPFAQNPHGIPAYIIPPFCNIVQMGSTLDVTTGSVVTDTAKRDIQATPDFPIEAEYSINAKGVLIDTPQGFVEQPATGSINAFMNVHTQEARVIQDKFSLNGVLFFSTPEADLVYKESTSASGDINSFSKNMYYQDGALRI